MGGDEDDRLFGRDRPDGLERLESGAVGQYYQVEYHYLRPLGAEGAKPLGHRARGDHARRLVTEQPRDRVTDARFVIDYEKCGHLNKDSRKDDG